ncbi:MAG: YigZ family protein, partial [Bacteroidales bacterium]
NARVLEKTLDAQISLSFEYPYTNEVMSIIKDCGAQIIHPQYEELCSMDLQIRLSKVEELKERLSKVDSLLIKNNE